MKACSKCGVNKPESEYFVKDSKSGRLHAQCKLCYKQHRKTYHVQHYRKYRENYLLRARVRREKLRSEFRTNLLEFLRDKACAVCEESDIRVLEFDHIDPTNKKFNISQAVKLGYSWEETLAEIKKCRVLCANCHKKHTSTQFNWYKQ